MSLKTFKGKVAFAVGTGRCGTKFIYELMHCTPAVYSIHERHPLNDAFHRYCKWYNLPVDDRGFLTVKEEAIRNDLKMHQFSFEASAHLSLSIRELYDHFGAKFVFMVRSPQAVVASYYRKGWYETPVVRDNPALAPGLHEANPLPATIWQEWGRIIPVDDKARRWNELTRVGRLAWYWNALNQRITEDLDKIPKSHFMVIKLEEFSYERYEKVLSFFNLEQGLTKSGFNEVAQKRPNRSLSCDRTISWSSKEVVEFDGFVEPMGTVFGYESSAPVENRGMKPPESAKIVASPSKLERFIRWLRQTYQTFILTEFRKRFYRL